MLAAAADWVFVDCSNNPGLMRNLLLPLVSYLHVSPLISPPAADGLPPSTEKLSALIILPVYTQITCWLFHLASSCLVFISFLMRQWNFSPSPLRSTHRASHALTTSPPAHFCLIQSSHVMSGLGQKLARIQLQIRLSRPFEFESPASLIDFGSREANRIGCPAQSAAEVTEKIKPPIKH